MSATATNGAVFVQDGDLIRATELARGPWDPGAQHGGAAAALLMREFERLDGPGLVLARVTYGFFRPGAPGGLGGGAGRVRAPGTRRRPRGGASRAPDGSGVVRARALGTARPVPDVPTTPSEPPAG